MPKKSFQNTTPVSFLIDECLTPALVKIAKERGYFSRHVSRIKDLKGKSDRKVTRYALENDMIVVTNNLVDFDQIYRTRDAHPGLIFMSASGNLINRETHILMFENALEELEETPITNEVIHIHIDEDRNKDIQLTLKRYSLI